MKGPLFIFRKFSVRALTSVGLITTGLLSTSSARANCPQPATSDDLPRFDSTVSADEEVHFKADSLDARKDGVLTLQGNVLIQQGVRQLKTRDATYDPNTDSFAVDNDVEFSDPNFTVRGESAQVDAAGGAVFEGAEFELKRSSARGAASRIRADAEGEIELRDVRYTTCPLGREDWVISASDIDIHQRAGIGTGRNARVDFKGVPILYTPFISFPVGNERKTGFLFPTPGTSTQSGTSLSVPWYWNIAPNYDATFLPTWYSKRGARLDSQFRYLTGHGRGVFEAEFLPDDQQYGDQRSLVHFADVFNFNDSLRLNTEATNVSDSQWFEDFGLGPEGTSITFVDRFANLTYLGENWLAILRAQNFQVIDDSIDPIDRPYTVLPQLALTGSWPEQPFGLTFGVDMELGNFEHNFDRQPFEKETGWRLDVAPEIRMPLRTSGIYLEPAASWRYTSYKLSNTENPDDTLSRSAPIFSVDGGVIFERLTGSKQQRLHTLEPRFMYLYVPYRDQSELPTFDTGLADLNLVQLFRTNRFIGADRLSDANQLSFGLTSRLFDADTGKEFLSATVGQAYYFHTPKVTLPDEVLDDTESSDIIAELDLRAYGNWNVGMGVQWDPGETRSEKGDVHVQYRPAFDRVVNLGYRFRRGNIEQVDGSVAWPIGESWSAYGRLVYSLEDSQVLDQFAGLEYRSCCWRLRVVAQRFVSNRTGDIDTSVQLQLELNGLSSVGDDADAFLERSIQGYSLRPPDP
jgi:LPS-assembly protein